MVVIIFSFLCTGLGVADVFTDTSRQVQSSHPSRAYSVEGPVRPCACQISPTLSPSNPGNHSSSTFKSVSHPFSLFRLNSRPFTQPDLVHTIEDALARLSQLRSMQVVQSSSNEATQEVLLKTLPQILVLHLERFMYDVATDSVNRIGKPVQFGPELEIPLGTVFLFVAPVSEC